MNKKEFYESLSDEVKEKIKACKSEQEMLKVLEDEQIELSPDLLDGVAGGGSGVCHEKWNVLKNCPSDDCICD